MVTGMFVHIVYAWSLVTTTSHLSTEIPNQGNSSLLTPAHGGLQDITRTLHCLLLFVYSFHHL